MIRTVDLVIAGTSGGTFDAAADALRHGRRVLVLLRSGDARGFRRRLCRTANVDCRQVTVMSGADVVCVDGVDGIEAVVIRHARTGRLLAVNASAFLSCDSR